MTDDEKRSQSIHAREEQSTHCCCGSGIDLIDKMNTSKMMDKNISSLRVFFILSKTDDPGCLQVLQD